MKLRILPLALDCRLGVLEQEAGRAGVQSGQDAPVDGIDITGPNILRRPTPTNGRFR